jgi:hypothetical protein
MCKKMKAKNFIQNYNVDSCIETFSNPSMFPEVDETQ